MGPVFASVAPTPAEVARALPGDALVPTADVVMDRAFSLAAPVATVWPWFEQLGKHRAGWYLPRSVERLVPPPRRALRRLEPALTLEVAQVIPDWGGRDATFEVALLEAPTTLVHTSRRGRTDLSWAIVLTPYDAGRRTRVHLRLRLAPVRRPRLARTLGGLVDELTVAGLAAGAGVARALTSGSPDIRLSRHLSGVATADRRQDTPTGPGRAAARGRDVRRGRRRPVGVVGARRTRGRAHCDRRGAGPVGVSPRLSGVATADNRRESLTSGDPCSSGLSRG